MRILHVINTLGIGGAQRLLSDIISLEKRTGNEIGVLVLKNEDIIIDNNIKSHVDKFISLGINHIYSPLVPLRIRKYLKGWDIVHVHLFPSLYWCVLASIGITAKLVYTEHSTNNKRRNYSFFRPIEKFVYGRYNAIVSISQQTQENLKLWLNPPRRNFDKFVIIENGIDLEKFYNSSLKSKKEILMVSRFAEMKDQATLIKAMEYVKPGFQLILVGDGPNRSFCEEIAKKKGVANRVTFLGTCNNISALVKRSFIGVQSSKWEGFGLTAVEFMAAGKPVICSNVPGLANVVGDAGLMFNVGNEIELARHINFLIDNPDKYSEYSYLSINKAKQYSIHKTIHEYNKLYSKLLHNE